MLSWRQFPSSLPNSISSGCCFQPIEAFPLLTGRCLYVFDVCLCVWVGWGFTERLSTGHCHSSVSHMMPCVCLGFWWSPALVVSLKWAIDRFWGNFCKEVGNCSRTECSAFPLNIYAFSECSASSIFLINWDVGKKIWEKLWKSKGHPQARMVTAGKNCVAKKTGISLRS